MSEPLFPEPEPGEAPADRAIPEGQHPWAPSVMARWERGEARKRRRIPWSEVANKARAAGGAWTLHSSLAVADLHLLHHARRRVRALRPDSDGQFEFARGNVAQDELGKTVFSIHIRFVKEGTQP